MDFHLFALYQGWFLSQVMAKWMDSHTLFYILCSSFTPPSRYLVWWIWIYVVCIWTFISNHKYDDFIQAIKAGKFIFWRRNDDK